MEYRMIGAGFVVCEIRHESEFCRLVQKSKALSKCTVFQSALTSKVEFAAPSLIPHGTNVSYPTVPDPAPNMTKNKK